MENSSSQKESDDAIYEDPFTDPQKECKCQIQFEPEKPSPLKETPRKPRLQLFFIILICILAIAVLALCIFIAAHVPGLSLSKSDDNHPQHSVATHVPGLSQSKNDDNHSPSSEFPITIYSDGCCSYNHTRDLQSLFRVNNTPVCLDWGNRHWGSRHRGFNFAIFDLPFGGNPRLEACETFDNYVNKRNTDVDFIPKFLEAIPGGRLVLVSVWDTGERLDDRSKSLLHSLNPSSKTINEISFREPYALIGYKNNNKTEGPCHPPWVTDLLGFYDAKSNEGGHIVLRANISSTWECATK